MESLACALMMLGVGMDGDGELEEPANTGLPG